MRALTPEVADRAKRVRLLVLDIDGVLTDGGLFYGPEGEAVKRFDVQDGLGIRILQHCGVGVAVISARPSGLVAHRMKDLGITSFSTGAEDKNAVLDQYLVESGLHIDQVAYVGDDLLDIPVMQRVGLAIAVANAQDVAKACAHAVTEHAGGQGAVREVANWILASRDGGLEAAHRDYLAAKTNQRPAEAQR